MLISHNAENDKQPDDKRTSPFRGALTAMLCSGAEFFDVTLFAIFAVSIGRTFFPNENPELELLAALAVFGATFVARPFGGFVIGAYADRYGRRSALVVTAGAMAIATAVIALMPGYNQIGWIAPTTIVLARLVQGVAFGGEVGPSTAYVFEIAPPNRKCLYASWQPAGQGVATMFAALLGLGLGASLGKTAFDDWGWRIPFLIGSAILWVALLMRRNMAETLVSQTSMKPEGSIASIRQLIVGYPKVLLSISSQIAFGTIAIYVSTYMNTYLVKSFGMPPSVSLSATALAGFSILAGSIFGGALADSYGVRHVVYLSRLILLIATYPLFLGAQSSVYGALLMSSLFPFLAMVSGGASFGAITSALPARLRSTGLSVAYAVVVCLFGGSLQFIMTSLIDCTGDQLVPAYFMMVATIVGIAGVPWLPNGPTSVKGLGQADRLEA